MNRKQIRVNVYKQKRQTLSALRTVNVETGCFDRSSHQSQFHNNLVSPQMVPPPDVSQFPPGPQQQFLVPPPQQQQQLFTGSQSPFVPHEGPPPVPHPFLQGVRPPNLHQFDPSCPFPPPGPRHVIPPPNMHQFEAPPPSQNTFLPEPHQVHQTNAHQPCVHQPKVHQPNAHQSNTHQFDRRPPPPQHPFPPPPEQHPPHGHHIFNVQPFPQDAPVPEPPQGNVPPSARKLPQTSPQENIPLQDVAQTGDPLGLPRVNGVPKSSINLQALTLYPHTVQAFLNRGGLKRKETKYRWDKVTVHNHPPDDMKNVERTLGLLYKPKIVATYMHWVEEDRLNFLMIDVDTMRLLRAGLKMPSVDSMPPIELIVTLSYSDMQLNQMIRSMLGKRFDKTKMHLDLSYVVVDPEVRRIFYDLNWHVCGWQMLIEEGARMAKELVSLSLAKNGLSSQALENLLGVVKTFQSLRFLDLSDNEIQALPAKKFQIHNVTEVSMMGNPLCQYFNDPDSYISALRQIFPSVTKLDGTFLSLELPPWRQVFLADEGSRLLADQFLEHFFGLYDGDRKKLRGLYHEDAQFSLSSSYLPGQSTSSSARLSAYAVESRNLLKLSDLSKAGHALYQGAEEVLLALCRLPQSKHDLSSFTVDVMRASPCVLTVTGVFSEPQGAVRYFLRTFVLLCLANHEFQVVNDQLYVTNASTRQAKEAFRYPRPQLCRPPRQAPPPPPQLSDCDKLQMAKILAQLTEMNRVWSYKCLDESQWDIKEALVVFSELLKLDRIPEAAFVKLEGDLLDV